MANSFLGSALLGLSNGVQQAQDDNQQRAYVKQAQTMQLQKMALMNKESDLTIQEKQAQLSDDQYMAQSMASMGKNPNDPSTGVQSVTGQPVFQTPPSTPQVAPQAPSQMGNNGRLPQQNNAVQSAPNSPGAGAAGFAGINAQSQASYNSPAVQNDTISLLQNELSNKKAALASSTDPTQKAQLEQDVAAVTKELAAKGGPRQLPPGIATSQANAVENKKDAGIPVSAPELGQAANSQMAMANSFEKLANKAYADGHPKVGAMYLAKANAIKKQALDYAKGNIDIRTKQNAEVKDVVGSIDPENMTQSDYSDMQRELSQNPVFAERFTALGLTGNIDNDRNKLAQFARQSETKAQSDTHDVALSTLKLNQQKAKDLAEARAQRNKQIQQQEDQQSAETMTPEAVRDNAYISLATGKVQSFGFGAAGNMNRVAILNEQTKIRKELGLSEIDMVDQRTRYHAMSMALNNEEKRFQAAQGNEQAANAAANLALNASQAYDRISNVPYLEKLAQEGKKSWVGDPNLTQLQNYVSTFAEEYAKVLGDVTGAGASTDSMRDEAHKRLESSMNPAQFKAAVEGMQKEMQLRLQAKQGNITNLVKATHLAGAPQAPDKGTVQDGYEFQGGDPANKNNWVKK